MVSGIPTASGYEERIRFSELEIVERGANEQGLLVNMPEGHWIHGWDVNVAGVRTTSVKRMLRYHQHAVRPTSPLLSFYFRAKSDRNSSSESKKPENQISTWGEDTGSLRSYINDYGQNYLAKYWRHSPERTRARYLQPFSAAWVAVTTMPPPCLLFRRKTRRITKVAP